MKKKIRERTKKRNGRQELLIGPKERFQADEISFDFRLVFVFLGKVTGTYVTSNVPSFTSSSRVHTRKGPDECTGTVL